MKIYANPTTLFRKENWFVSAYYGVRSWIKYTFNRDHLALMKEAYKTRPYDYSFLFRMEYDKIKEMANYLEKADRFIGAEYVVRDMRICLSLLEIILGERNTFHFTGTLCFKDIPEEERNEGGLGKDEKVIEPTPDFKYHCDVHVNLKNMKRFVLDEKHYDFYTKNPHELYELKAKALYHKIRYEHDMEWWD